MTKDIGRFMQEMRKNADLTQKELADKIGVSDKTISKWENGNSMPDTSILLSLCSELNITVSELLSCEKNPSENYSVKAEENIMNIMKENEQSKKRTRFSIIIGIVVLVIGILFFGISIAGIRFPIENYIDLPSLLIIAFLLIGVILISGAKTKENVLLIISKTILPIALAVSTTSAILVLSILDNLELLGPNLAVVFLSLLYAAIIKIVADVLLLRGRS